MNPHYGPYYSGEGPPADYYNPIPIFFLTLQNVKFNIYIGVKARDKDKKIPQDSKLKTENILEAAVDFLKAALENHGVGAKTALGYGVAKTGRDAAKVDGDVEAERVKVKREPEKKTVESVTLTYTPSPVTINTDLGNNEKAFTRQPEVTDLIASIPDELREKFTRKKNRKSLSRMTVDVELCGGRNYKILSIRPDKKDEKTYHQT